MSEGERERQMIKLIRRENRCVCKDMVCVPLCIYAIIFKGTERVPTAAADNTMLQFVCTCINVISYVLWCISILLFLSYPANKL